MLKRYKQRRCEDPCAWLNLVIDKYVRTIESVLGSTGNPGTIASTGKLIIDWVSPNSHIQHLAGTLASDPAASVFL